MSARAQGGEGVDGGGLDWTEPGGDSGTSGVSTRHVWVVKAWGLTQSMGHYCIVDLAGLRLWHLLRLPLDSVLCSGNRAPYMQAASWDRRSLHSSTERGSTFMIWEFSHSSSHKNPSASHSWSPV